MRIVLICFLVLLVSVDSVSCYAQNKVKIDSLQSVIYYMNDDTSKVKLLRLLFKEYESNDHDKAEQTAFEELRLSRRTNYKYGEATAYRHLGNLRSESGHGAEAIAYHLKALKIYEELKKPFFVAACYNNIGEVYRSRNETWKAEINFKEAIRIWMPLAEGQEGVAIAIAGLGEICLFRNELEVARQHYEKALELAVKSDLLHLQCESYARLASIAIMQRRKDAAQSLLSTAMAIARAIHAGDVLTKVCYSYSDLNISNGNYDLALVHGKLAYAYAIKISSAEWKVKCVEQLAGISKALKAYKEASDYQELYIQLADSLHNVEQALKIEKLQHDYVIEKKELANVALIKEREVNQRIQMWRWRVGGVVFVFVLCIALFYWRHAVQQKRLALILAGQKLEIEKQANEIMIRNDEILRQYEQIKRQNENLFNLNQALNKLFSLIDLRAPFKTIEGVIGLFKNKLLSATEFTDLSVKLEDIVIHTEGLLDNLLLWSKTQMHGTQVKLSTFLLNKLLNECVLILTPQAEQKHIQIHLEANYSVAVVADSDMVAVIVRNLLSNAIKFSPCYSSVHIDFVVRQQWVHVTIADAGTGISSNVKEKLFDRYLFYSTPGTENEKGTGLGLNLFREYVHLNGGSIRVDSELGQGSVFEFTLRVEDSS